MNKEILLTESSSLVMVPFHNNVSCVEVFINYINVEINCEMGINV
ncbi:hypothetical protein QA612_06500 [Evansella sp. AB-P1]|nr:hypothetical protein [Evansella sp. AB-P1]MDG5787137.1 hypothetical protein [Evansella sp. AB-P1]